MSDLLINGWQTWTQKIISSVIAIFSLTIEYYFQLDFYYPALFISNRIYDIGHRVYGHIKFSSNRI